MMKIPQHHIHDFVVRRGAVPGNPLTENPYWVPISATFEHESGEILEDIPGFYSGGDTWTVRFSPTRTGRWVGRTSSTIPTLSDVTLGPITCVEQAEDERHGILGIDPVHPQRFAWSDGTPHLTLSFECDWLFAYHQTDPEQCSRHLDLIAARGFNTVITNVYAHTGFSTPEARGDASLPPEASVYGPPEAYVFGGTNNDPDHETLNLDFFEDFDRLMHAMHTRGLVVHLMIQVQNKHVCWPGRLSAADNAYWRYVVARYQAFGNVIWDVGKESYNLLRETGSHDYTLSRIALIRHNDAYNHLVTVHDPEGASLGRYSAVDEACDFASHQVHTGRVDRYNREATRMREILPKPYFNIEYGYEEGAETFKTYQSRTTASWQDVLKWTYALLAAGAYPGYYYSNTAWDLIRFEPEPPGWMRYRYLRDFIDRLPFNEMAGMNVLVDRGYCLADPGRAYFVYLPEGGDALVDLTDLPSTRSPRGDWRPAEADVRGQWMNIYSGQEQTVTIEPTGWLTEIPNPLEDPDQPCVLAITYEEA
jgi:hypothetical protein